MSQSQSNLTEVRKEYLSPMSLDNADSILSLIAKGEDRAFNLLIDS